jgi:hypothetical protein
MGLMDAFKSSKDRDQRDELAKAITDPWSGSTAAFVGIAFLDREAAMRGFSLFEDRALGAHAANVVIVRGFLTADPEPESHVVGLICPDNDRMNHASWLSGAINSAVGSKGKKILQMEDKGPYEFGASDSPIAIYDFAPVRLAR